MADLRIIYHVPYPLVFENPGGSGVRPVKMLRALESIGEVWLVSGHTAERKKAIAKVDAAIARGVTFDLVYSESSTMPTALTDPDHLPRHPFMDFAFLHRMRRHGLKVGLFYRDIYWRFDDYAPHVPRLKRLFSKAMYRYDCLAYRLAVDVLYLPSEQMAAYVPFSSKRTKPLPPGHDIVGTPPETNPAPLSLLFVGGFNDHYRLHELFAAVQQCPDVHLTVCTRESEWQAARHSYEEYLADNIEIVHRHGEGLKELFAKANIGVLCIEPSEYRNFAAPLKFYEYIGNGKPILCSNHTLTGDLVTKWGIGWTVDYDRKAFVDLLHQLTAHPDQVSERRSQVLNVRMVNSWRGRAGQIVKDLTGRDVDLSVGSANS
ncbi:glycosyltransferase [Luteococcus sp. OSA5]|uniref:glycosyltransferase n=1 Tax=Luteococcus sp. OSA5 TaxID=3401630 RepID=UPI003B42F7C8